MTGPSPSWSMTQLVTGIFLVYRQWFFSNKSTKWTNWVISRAKNCLVLLRVIKTHPFYNCWVLCQDHAKVRVAGGRERYWRGKQMGQVNSVAAAAAAAVVVMATGVKKRRRRREADWSIVLCWLIWLPSTCCYRGRENQRTTHRAAGAPIQYMAAAWSIACWKVGNWLPFHPGESSAATEMCSLATDSQLYFITQSVHLVDLFVCLLEIPSSVRFLPVPVKDDFQLLKQSQGCPQVSELLSCSSPFFGHYWGFYLTGRGFDRRSWKQGQPFLVGFLELPFLAGSGGTKVWLTWIQGAQ